MRMLSTALAAASLFCILGCGDAERIPADAPGYVDGKAVHPTIKIGRPYRIDGEKYYPEYDPHYDEVGIASWYGPNFHGKMTANGEEYNQWAMTAAHPTLPMPSMVRVTDLKTGRAIVVRINDRGPFAEGRIIDLSRAAAEELGVRARGLAKVRVQYLKPETEAYIAKLQLKKPDVWKETDIALAQAKVREALARPAKAPEPQRTPPASLPELRELGELPEQPEQPEQREQAAHVPDHFAYEAPEPVRTTIDVRGLTLEEIGYAEDAFSVLDETDYGPPPASSSVRGRPHSALPLATPPGDYYVRAGTFSVRENAYQLAEKLRRIADVQVTPLYIGEGEFWKVSLGPAFNRGVAAEISRKLMAYGIRDAKIVRATP